MHCLLPPDPLSQWPTRIELRLALTPATFLRHRQLRDCSVKQSTPSRPATWSLGGVGWRCAGGSGAPPAPDRRGNRRNTARKAPYQGAIGRSAPATMWGRRLGGHAVGPSWPGPWRGPSAWDGRHPSGGRLRVLGSGIPARYHLSFDRQDGGGRRGRPDRCAGQGHPERAGIPPRSES